MKGSNRMRRRIGVAAVAVTGMGATLVVPATPASAFTKPPQAYGGYSSGAETYANLVPGSPLAQARVACANSAVNSQGLTTIND